MKILVLLLILTPLFHVAQKNIFAIKVGCFRVLSSLPGGTERGASPSVQNPGH